MNLEHDDKEQILNSLINQHDNFMKVLTYCGFLLETVRETKSNLKLRTSRLSTLIDKNKIQRLSLNNIQADLKHDDGLVMELEKEIAESERREKLLENRAIE